jgi:hypothetical protein
MNLIPVKDNPNYFRAGNSIVNADKTSYSEFVNKRNREKSLELKVNQLESKLDLILKKLGIEDGTN